MNQDKQISNSLTESWLWREQQVYPKYPYSCLMWKFAFWSLIPRVQWASLRAMWMNTCLATSHVLVTEGREFVFVIRKITSLFHSTHPQHTRTKQISVTTLSTSLFHHISLDSLQFHFHSNTVIWTAGHSCVGCNFTKLGGLVLMHECFRDIFTDVIYSLFTISHTNVYIHFLSQSVPSSAKKCITPFRESSSTKQILSLLVLEVHVRFYFFFSF